MAINLFEEFTPELVAAQWRTLYSDTRPYLYPAFLPGRRVTRLTLKWLKGENDLPITLEPSALDTKPIIRERRVPRYQEVEIPFFRESAIRNERDVMELFQFFSSPSSDTYGAQDYLDRLLNDGARLIESNRVNKEIMFCGLITTAGFTINGKVGTSNEGNDYVFNYDPTGDWAANNVRTTVDWSDPTADILGEIIRLKNELRLEGKSLGAMVIGAETAADIANNEAIKAMLNTGVLDVNVLPLLTYDTDVFVQRLASLVGLRIIVHDKAYGDKTNLDANGIPQATFYYPQRGTISFLPPDTIGNMCTGYTPEEIYYTNGSGTLNGSVLNTAGGEVQSLAIVDGGIAVCNKKVMLPAQATIWVAGFFAPTFPAIDNVYVMNYTPA